MATITGTSANDLLTGSADHDTLDGAEGNDTLRGMEGNDSLSGGDGNDSLEGQSGNDTLLGGAGSDTLRGGAGNDRLDGGDITDRVGYSDYNLVNYSDALSGVQVNLGTGSALDGYGSTDTLVNIDYVVGSAYADRLTGSDTLNLFEYFEGLAGNDTIDGGEIVSGSSNRASYQSAPAAVSVNLATGLASDGYGGTDVLSNINHLRGSAYGDTLTGSDATGWIESFDGRAGNDTIDGRGGADSVRYEAATAGVVVNLAAGIAADGQGGTDVLSGIENVIGTGYADLLTGNAEGNALDARVGNDTLLGGDGPDTLTGGAGDDLLFGGSQRIVANPDTANLSNHYDLAVFSDATAGVVVVLGTDGTSGTASGGGIGNDVLVDIELVVGSSYDDVISGSNREVNEIIRGGPGDDTLSGGAASGIDLGFNIVDYNWASGPVTVDLSTGRASGAAGTDVLQGFIGILGSDHDDSLVGDAQDNYFDPGPGDDTIDGRRGSDRVSYQNASSGVTVSLADGNSSGPDGSDTLINIEALRGSEFADLLSGSSGSDDIQGRDGADTLTGGAGNDTLHGGYGNDQIFGGAGDDSLVGDEGNDLIQGGSGNDWIVPGNGSDLISGGGGLDTVVFTSTRAAATVTATPFGLFVTQPGQGTDNLSGAERLRFADGVMALDIDKDGQSGMGHAGVTAKIAHVLFGSAGLADRALLAQMLAQLDGGTSYPDVVASWVGSARFAAAAGAGAGPFTAVQFVDLVYRNLVGQAPDAASSALFAGMLTRGELTPATLAFIASEHPLNLAAVDLVGLASTGLEVGP